MAALVGWMIGGLCLALLLAFALGSVGLAALALREDIAKLSAPARDEVI
jgi:hypothetical protein